jgi:hypothetical protein
MIPGRIVRYLQGKHFVYCAQAWQRAAVRITWRIPITCPPVTAENFDPAWMEGKRLLIFKLHGYPDDPNWYGLGPHQGALRVKPMALTPDLVRSANLTGAIVLAIVCHGAESAMQAAFCPAGARAFFGSIEEVRARETRPGETDNLAHHLLSILARGHQDLTGALARAQEHYRETAMAWTEHDEFTLQTFRLFTPKGEIHV